jgi:FixJ family two-component response regulator
MTATDVSSVTIFVVDDDPAGRESLCDLLRSQGRVCEAYESAQEFVAQFDRDRCGCIVTDYRMPGMNGIELQAALAERGSRLPVIVVSGFADVPVAVRAMQSGAVTLLQKPYDREELLASVDAAAQLAVSRWQHDADSRQIAARLASLSPDEQQVMQMLVAGKPNKTVARELDIGLRTVERRRQQILEKVGVGSLPELAALFASHYHQQVAGRN